MLSADIYRDEIEFVEETSKAQLKKPEAAINVVEKGQQLLYSPLTITSSERENVIKMKLIKNFYQMIYLPNPNPHIIPW